jgi:hypothetical protein
MPEPAWSAPTRMGSERSPRPHTSGGYLTYVAKPCYGALTLYPLPVWMNAMTDISSAAETRAYTVAGMTCSHCVLSVREEVSVLPTVEAADAV